MKERVMKKERDGGRECRQRMEGTKPSRGRGDEARRVTKRILIDERPNTQTVLLRVCLRSLQRDSVYMSVCECKQNV